MPGLIRAITDPAVTKEHLVLMLTCLSNTIEDMLVAQGCARDYAQDAAQEITKNAGAFAARVGSFANLKRMEEIEKEATADTVVMLDRVRAGRRA